MLVLWTLVIYFSFYFFLSFHGILAQIQSLFYKPSCLPLPWLDFQFLIISNTLLPCFSPFTLIYLTQTNSLFFCNIILYSTISLLLTCLNCKIDFYGDVFFFLIKSSPSCNLSNLAIFFSSIHAELNSDFCQVNRKNESRFCSFLPTPHVHIPEQLFIYTIHLVLSHKNFSELTTLLFSYTLSICLE